MDKDLLLKPRLPEADVDLPGVGTVRVRGLSRAEQLLAVKQGDVLASGDVNITRVGAIECRMLVFGMVDPPMSEEDIGTWQRVAPAGDIEAVTKKISELSGMLPGSQKDAMRSFPDDTGAGVRVLPGGGTGYDGGEPAGADVGR